jgi:thiamine-phosphate pyrophosphorylase
LRREAKPILCYVTDGLALSPSTAFRTSSTEGHSDNNLLALIRRGITTGINWIQIREKDMPTRPLLELARGAVNATRRSDTRILINDRLDVALSVGAAGVHLGERALPVAEVARWCRASGQENHAPEGFLVGASCHLLAAATEAEHDGADYIFFGPVFMTPSKAAYGPPQGLSKLAAVCRRVRIPVLAIGGITLENAAACLNAGAAGLAAIRLFQESTDLATTVAQLRAAL